MAAMSLLRSDFSIASNSWYEKAGAAGIQLEDQEFPKKCGHTPGRRVIATGEMVKKIRFCCNKDWWSRRSPLAFT